MTFFSSLGSLGSSRTLSSSSTLAGVARAVEFVLGHGAHVGVGVGEHGFGFGDAGLDLAVLAELFDGGLHVAVLLGDGLVFFWSWTTGSGHLVAEVFVAGFELVEAVEHWTYLRFLDGLAARYVSLSWGISK